MANVETHSKPASFLTQKFFIDEPTAVDYYKVVYQKIGLSSLSEVDAGSTVEFNLPPLDGSKVYIMKDLIFRCALSIKLEDGREIPTKGNEDVAQVSIVNLPLHSIIERLSVTLNDTEVSICI